MKNSIKKLIRDKQRGVAILIVLVSLTLLAAIVTELSTKETVRYKLAINGRDALKAEALAQSAVNFSRLVLTVQEPLQGFLTKFANAGIPLPSYTIWSLFPIDSDFLKSFTSGDITEIKVDGEEEGKEEREEKEEKALEKTDETIKLVGPYEAPPGGYGSYNGEFSAFIEDEEQKIISLRKWVGNIDPPQKKLIADILIMILSQPKYRALFDGSTGDNKNIGPKQLVGLIYDHFSDGELAVDVNAPANNWGRDFIGSKKILYGDNPDISPKKAMADSIYELKLIPGVTDAIFKVLSKYVTIYGETEGVNILSASDDMLPAIFYTCANDGDKILGRPNFMETLVDNWNNKKSEGKVTLSAEGITKFLEENRVEPSKENCKKLVGTESKNFTIRATAKVGNITKNLIVRLRSAAGFSNIYYYEYL